MDTQITSIEPSAVLAIAMDAVDSSQIKAVGYDIPSQTLAVEFYRAGKDAPPDATSLYHYFAVPQDQHTALIAAESKGKHLDANIKRKFEYKRIR